MIHLLQREQAVAHDADSRPKLGQRGAFLAHLSPFCRSARGLLRPEVSNRALPLRYGHKAPGEYVTETSGHTWAHVPAFYLHI